MQKEIPRKCGYCAYWSHADGCLGKVGVCYRDDQQYGFNKPACQDFVAAFGCYIPNKTFPFSRRGFSRNKE